MEISKLNNQNNGSNNGSTKEKMVTILVVDDDRTCLSLIASLLKGCAYRVLTAKDPLDALCILRTGVIKFDLVVYDVHMPGMDGFELQRRIHQDFQLPVVCGASLFVSKPITTEDLKSIWDFVNQWKKNLAKGKNLISDDSSAKDNEDDTGNKLYEKLSKRKLQITDNEDHNHGKNRVLKDKALLTKKNKLNWTPFLHDKFVRAVQHLGPQDHPGAFSLLGPDSNSFWTTTAAAYGVAVGWEPTKQNRRGVASPRHLRRENEKGVLRRRRAKLGLCEYICEEAAGCLGCVRILPYPDRRNVLDPGYLDGGDAATCPGLLKVNAESVRVLPDPDRRIVQDLWGLDGGDVATCPGVLVNPKTLSFYSRDLSEAYGGPDGLGGREPYNEDEMNRKFFTAPGTRYECGAVHKEVQEKYTDAEVDGALRLAFNLDDTYQWRWPEEHERVYHRPEGGWVGIPLEHLRGMRLGLHQFTKSLCRDVYGIPFTQLAPNSVKWISWFLACCHAKNYPPTFKLFHHIFKIKRSTARPIYEFIFRIEDCGYPSDKMVLPVSMLTSLKGWHREFIFVRGGDLEFMPLHKLEIKTDRFPDQWLGQAALAMVYAFCGALGTQWTRDYFTSNENMHAAGCGAVSPGEDNNRDQRALGRGRAAGDVIRVPVPRKRKGAPASSGDKGDDVSEGPVSKKSVVDVAPDTPETLNALLASFTPETRRRELFENYASTAERKKYKKEPLDDFLVGLQEDITVAKADAAEVYKTESERLSWEIQELKEASAREAAARKKILDEIRERQDRAEASVREMRAENQKLRDDLAARPTPEEVLAGFRGNPAYFEELNDKALEKIQICWNVASKYLGEESHGTIDVFLEKYIEEETRLEQEKEALRAMESGVGTSSNVPSFSGLPLVEQPPVPEGNPEQPPSPPADSAV
ncbi:hypothetical protein AgCh_023266 [Apium graveolens]